MSLALIVVDTETGGLDPDQHCIIEIAAQTLLIGVGEVTLGADFYRRIKPDRPVSPEAARVNGYTPEGWASADDPALALGAFRTWLSGQAQVHEKPTWCGCNPVFDLKFFNSDRKRHDVAEPAGLGYRLIDVQSMAVSLVYRGEISSVSLSALRKWAGCEGEQKHTALADVLDTCRVVGALLMGKG
jgi:DNA polymerase III epsilon subunit-like protein